MMSKEDKREYHRKRYASGVYPYQEMSRLRRETPDGRAGQLLRAARARSKIKGIECTVSIDWIKKRIASGRCELTGIGFCFSQGGGLRNPFSPSLDRVDCGRGYTEDNCRVVLWAINAGIGDFGESIYSQVAMAYLARRERH